jgi:hypothetical protein
VTVSGEEKVGDVEDGGIGEIKKEGTMKKEGSGRGEQRGELTEGAIGGIEVK